MVNAPLHHVGRLSEGSQQERPGIVHRLDKDTTGLLVVARDGATHRALSEASPDARSIAHTSLSRWGAACKGRGPLRRNLGATHESA